MREEIYNMDTVELLALDLASMAPGDLSELSYFVWCWHEENPVLQEWRNKILLPILDRVCPDALPVEAIEDVVEDEIIILEDIDD